jgi:hypothetical protein
VLYIREEGSSQEDIPGLSHSVQMEVKDLLFLLLAEIKMDEGSHLANIFLLD